MGPSNSQTKIPSELQDICLWGTIQADLIALISTPACLSHTTSVQIQNTGEGGNGKEGGRLTNKNVFIRRWPLCYNKGSPPGLAQFSLGGQNLSCHIFFPEQSTSRESGKGYFTEVPRWPPHNSNS